MVSSPQPPDRGTRVGSPAFTGSGAERESAAAQAAAAQRLRCRSFCFLEREGQSYTVFLVTYAVAAAQWRGYFSFRAADGTDGAEVRTADLFVERSEREIDERARGLGRPLMLALLESALHTYEQSAQAAEGARQSLRELLAKRASELAEEDPAEGEQHLSLARLRSLYDSYRLDQVAHLIGLLAPDDFQSLVARLLEGRVIDFRSRDRFQLAMLVVQEIEQHLPLPPFEHWVADYLAHRETYRLYAHALHREGRLT